MNFKLIITTVVFLALILNSSLYGSDRNSDLKNAYKKEFAFLEQQKKALQKMLDEFKRNSESQIEKGEREVSALQDEFLKLSIATDSLQTALIEAERESSEVVEKQEVIKNTIEQASSTLSKHGFKNEFSDEEIKNNGAHIVSELFSNAVTALSSVSKIKLETGEFYLNDGKAVNGEIYKIGAIGAFGISPQGLGTLAPAGNLSFKLWHESDMASAEGIKAGKYLETVKMFMFESLDKEAEQKKSKGPLDVIRAGGAIAWVIVYLGMFTLLLIILRVAFLRSASGNTAKLIKGIEGYVREGNINSAIAYCNTNKGAISRVVAATLRNVDRDSEHIEDIISEAILHENTWLDRFGSLILVFASVAPLLGLLGTVTGMISTFDIITEFGTGDPKLLSSGISEALITTELGLIVAIPALLFGNLLSGWAGNIKNDMEQAALHVLNLFRCGTKECKECEIVK